MNKKLYMLKSDGFISDYMNCRDRKMYKIFNHFNMIYFSRFRGDFAMSMESFKYAQYEGPYLKIPKKFNNGW